MFEALGQRFTKLFSGLRGKVSQSQLNDFAADVKTALLDSDVALSVAESFSNQLLEKFTQNSDEINRSTNPSQKISSHLDVLLRVLQVFKERFVSPSNSRLFVGT